ncbi:MAG TPA: citrate/2-methylcitrate synthase [Planctomycetaceae bacterium]
MDGSPQTGGCPEFVAGLRTGLLRLTDRIATEAEVFDPSLESIVAAETAVSAFDDVPSLRGYALADLVRQASFPEVVFLLLRDDLPDVDHLADFQSVLTESAEVPQAVSDLIAALPLNVAPMEVLRTAVSALAHFDPQPDERDRAAAVGQTLRLLARLPLALAARQAAWTTRPAAEADPDAGYAANLLTLLTGREPTAEAEAAFEAALVVAAEQGLDASTLAARAAVSTGGDLFAAVTAAMSVWAGPLHGGPRPEVLDWLRKAASNDPETFIRKEIAQGHSFPGFDLRLTAVGDVRAAWLTPFCRRLAAETGNEAIEQAAEAAERLIAEETGAGPALDWPLSRLLYHLGVDPDLFKPVAAVARVAGWAAHAVEQSEHNQLLRPRGRYVGPKKRPFRPLEERG